MAATALYRHFSADGNLLYAGISLSPLYRLSQHGASKWFHDIAHVSIEWFDDRDAALKAERLAIASERPLHNTQHNSRSELKQIVDAVGRKNIASRVGVGMTAVSNGVVRGQFPASWYVVCLNLAEEAGVDCPPELFGQKSIEASS